MGWGGKHNRARVATPGMDDDANHNRQLHEAIEGRVALIDRRRTLFRRWLPSGPQIQGAFYAFEVAVAIAALVSPHVVQYVAARGRTDGAEYQTRLQEKLRIAQQVCAILRILVVAAAAYYYLFKYKPVPMETLVMMLKDYLSHVPVFKPGPDGRMQPRAEKLLDERMVRSLASLAPYRFEKSAMQSYLRRFDRGPVRRWWRPFGART